MSEQRLTPEGEISMSESERAREAMELEYKRLVDIYHYELEKERTRSNRTLPGTLSPQEALALTSKRDEVHRRLLEIGFKLGIPEFGLLGHDDGWQNSWPITLQINPRTKEYSNWYSAEEDRLFTQGEIEADIEQEIKAQCASLREEGLEADEKSLRVEMEESYTERQEDEDGLIVTGRLKPQEVAIIFGAKFLDLDFGLEEMVPFGYLEQERRAKAAARSYGLKAFGHNAFAPHDATTFIGIVVPVERLDEVANRLRGDRTLFGVRLQDMDQEAIARDRKTILGEALRRERERATYGYETYAQERERFLGDVLSPEELVDPDADCDEGHVDDQFPELEPPVRGMPRASGASKRSREK